MRLIFFTFFLLSVTILNGQEKVSLKFHEELKSINNSGMLVLGSLAIGNIGYSSFNLNHENETFQRFHQMNIGWNLVNLSLATLSLIQNKKNKNFNEPHDLSQFQRKTENIFLINSMLDIGYITAGVIMSQLNSKNLKNEATRQGFGQSLVLQGGFLLVFDGIMYFTHKRHKKKNLQLFPSTDGSTFQLNTSLKING